jgi:uncharacterized membrane protein
VSRTHPGRSVRAEASPPASGSGLTDPAQERRGPRAPGVLLGVGLGGFIDGIALHQLLQWHHMLSSTAANPPTTVAGLEANTLADGLFHTGTWIAVAASTALLVRSWQRGLVAPPWPRHLGLLLIGWGAFNLVEGIINHLLLDIHHVRDDLGGPLGWDLAFLASGLLLLACGALLAAVYDGPAARARSTAS